MRVSTLLLVFVGITASPLWARAQSADDEAKKEFASGTRAFSAGKFAEAAQAFEAAASIKPNGVALYTAALAWEQASSPDRAADDYGRALELPASGLDAQQQSTARERLASLEKTLGTVVLSGPEGTRVRVDELSEAMVPVRLHATAGTHSLAVQYPGKPAEKRDVLFVAGQAKNIDLTPVAAPPPPPKPAADASPVVQVASLKLLLEKKIINQDEYDSAMRDISSTAGLKAAGDTTTLVVGKFATTIYGFVEADAIHDSTEGLSDLQGNTQIARNETFAGQHGQLLGSIRNSRLGIRIKAPEFHGIRVSGQFEFDFLGNQPAVGYPPGAGVSEASFWANAGLRERHINLKVETPVLDFLFGQYWALFGWQPYFHINTVDLQGVPTEVYSRRPQIRLSKTIKSDPVNVEIAAAALNPPQRASECPEGQAGLRLTFNHWKGKRTDGSTGTAIEPASLGVSGDLKYIKVPVFPAANTTTDLVGSAISFDAFLPVIPASDEGKSGNNLTLTGNFATGYGMADQYTAFTGGVTFPSSGTPPTYPQNVDNGIVTFDAAGNLHYVLWYVGNAGLQYYFPGVGGKVWVSLNYGHAESPNTVELGNPAKVRASLDWLDGNLFADPVPGLRLGLGFGRTYDNYGDGQTSINDRVQGSAFFIF